MLRSFSEWLLTMESTQPLFAEDPNGQAKDVAGKLEKPQAAPRVLMPNRGQMEFHASDLESLLPEGHRARIVWGYVERQNLEGLYAGIRAVCTGSHYLDTVLQLRRPFAWHKPDGLRGVTGSPAFQDASGDYNGP